MSIQTLISWMKEPILTPPGCAHISWGSIVCSALHPLLKLISDGHGIVDYLPLIVDHLFPLLDTIGHTWPREYSVSAVNTLGQAAASAGPSFILYLSRAMGCLETVINVTKEDDSLSRRAALAAMINILLSLGEAQFMPYFPVVVKTIIVGLSSTCEQLRTLCYEQLVTVSEYASSQVDIHLPDLVPLHFKSVCRKELSDMFEGGY